MMLRRGIHSKNPNRLLTSQLRSFSLLLTLVLIPSTPSKDQLMAHSEEFKAPVTSADCVSEANPRSEIRPQILEAVGHDFLDNPAREASSSEVDPDLRLSSSAFTTTAEVVSATEGTLINGLLLIDTADELSRRMADSVSSALADWQNQLTELFAGHVKTLYGSPSSNQFDMEKLQGLETELSETRYQLRLVNEQLAECQSELKNYRAQWERSKERITELEFSQLYTSSKSDEARLLHQLKLQLDDSLSELGELRQQNSELAAKLAQQLANTLTAGSPFGNGSVEQLSWEERKILILKQLEGDSVVSSQSIPHRDKVEIHEIIETSQLEITRRDAQIEELREIIRTQSDARNGVAIGAAGVAQLIDSDPIVQEERQKLRAIQQEWESKLRQAEIELSLERAKIARERMAMEKQKEQLTQVVPNQEPNERIVERRWLKILGLKEDGS